MTRRRGFTDLVDRLPKTRAAIAYARREHAGQLRAADGAPFIEHPLEVGRLLYDAGAADHVIAAGVLHDTLEKTDATAPELSARFGSQVAELVCAVTEDAGISGYARRKAALREQVANAGHDALTVFAADKISKARELRRGDGGRTLVRNRRLKHYRHCLEMLEEHIPDSPLVGQLRAELARLPQRPQRVLTA